MRTDQYPQRVTRLVVEKVVEGPHRALLPKWVGLHVALVAAQQGDRPWLVGKRHARQRGWPETVPKQEAENCWQEAGMVVRAGRAGRWRGRAQPGRPKTASNSGRTTMPWAGTAAACGRRVQAAQKATSSREQERLLIRRSAGQAPHLYTSHSFRQMASSMDDQRLSSSGSSPNPGVVSHTCPAQPARATHQLAGRARTLLSGTLPARQPGCQGSSAQGHGARWASQIV